jgi:hypothetical protein
MINQRSDENKTLKCLMILALAASVIASGCASVKGSKPGLSATPISAGFSDVAMGSRNSQTITLQNSGNTSVMISSAKVAGAGFSTSGLTLPMTIAAGQNAAFNVVFAPTSAGNATGSISVVSDAPNSPLAIATSGIGVASAPSLSSSMTSLDFGSVSVASSSALGVTLTNTGNVNITLASVLVTGAGFSANGAEANTTLTPGQTAALNVMFAPSTTKSMAGSIAVTSNAGALSIALAGSGGQLSSDSVTLNWGASASDIVGYNIYRVLADGTYTGINKAPLVLTNYTDTNIQSGQTYTYVVTAVNSDNVESDYSDPVIAIIPEELKS